MRFWATFFASGLFIFCAMLISMGIGAKIDSIWEFELYLFVYCIESRQGIRNFEIFFCYNDI